MNRVDNIIAKIYKQLNEKAKQETDLYVQDVDRERGVVTIAGGLYSDNTGNIHDTHINYHRQYITGSNPITSGSALTLAHEQAQAYRNMQQASINHIQNHLDNYNNTLTATGTRLVELSQSYGTNRRRM